MARRGALAAITAKTCTGRDAARDIDWRKVRRVQHGLGRPPETRGLLSDEEVAVAERRERASLRDEHLGAARGADCDRRHGRGERCHGPALAAAGDGDNHCGTGVRRRSAR